MQKATRVSRCLAVVDANEDPAGGPIISNEQIATGSLARHSGQILCVDVDVSRLIGFETTVLRAGFPSLQIAQVSNAMPLQTSIQPRVGYIRVQELSHHGQQIIQRYKQLLTQRHRDGLLRRLLESERCMAATVYTVALAPIPNCLLGDAVALRHSPSGLLTR